MFFFFSSFHKDAVEDGSDNMIELKNVEFNKYFKKNCNNNRSFDFELIENFQFMESTDWIGEFVRDSLLLIDIFNVLMTNLNKKMLQFNLNHRQNKF